MNFGNTTHFTRNSFIKEDVNLKFKEHVMLIKKLFEQKRNKLTEYQGKPIFFMFRNKQTSEESKLRLLLLFKDISFFK